jgi:hypothetical protein
MSTKTFIFVCLVSAAFAASLTRHHEPNHNFELPLEPNHDNIDPDFRHHHPGHDFTTEKPANYKFRYEVYNATTGDIKEQEEEAVEGYITGYYALNDPDGYRRTVTYTAGRKEGFNAKVERVPLAQLRDDDDDYEEVNG